jgi:hypothetical protein
MDTTTRAAVDHLQAVGFSESEALAYATLVQRGPMTGYQLAKTSGIARPNVYGVIDKLEKRGAITRIGVGEGVQYGALPPAEMLARLSSGIDAHLSAAQDAFGSMGDAGGDGYVWNLEGYTNVLERAETVADGARERLLVGLWSAESARIGETVRRAEERGVRVVTLCVEGCATPCGGCRGDVYRYTVAPGGASRWLMLVADDREVLLGEIAPGGDARAAHTSLPMIVSVASQYLRNTIAAAEIVRSMGPRLPKMLDREAARAVQGEGLGTDRQSWLKQLVTAVRRVRP